MKYRIRVGVEGEVYLPHNVERLEAQRDELTFELTADAVGRVSQISVARKVPQERVERFDPRSDPALPTAKQRFTLGGRVRATPYNQRDFEAPAFFAMYLASCAVEAREKAGWRVLLGEGR